MDVETRVWKTITGIGTLLAIISTAYDIFSKNQKQLSIITIILLVSATLFILFLIFTSHPFYSLKKWFFWFINFFEARPYMINNHEVRYVYHDSSRLDYYVLSDIKIQENGVCTYAGRVRWTKSMSKDEYKRLFKLDGSSCSSMTLIGKWKYTWWNYIVWFDEKKKGESVEIKTKMINLQDPNGESQPQLTKAILKRIKTLKQTVEFEPGKVPKKLYYEIFKDTGDTPCIKEEYDFQTNSSSKKSISHLTFNASTNTATATIHKPIQGYRYRLHWEF